MKNIVIIGIFVAILVLLIILTVFGQRGVLQMNELRQELNELHTNNKKLVKENRELRKEIDLLTHDIRYIEEVARRELGLVKENELVYRLESTD